MTEKVTTHSVSGTIAFVAALINAIVLRNGMIDHERWYWALLITVPLLLYALTDFYMNRQHRDALALREQFSRLGESYHLTFSSEEVLDHCMLGVDGQNRKILLVKQIDFQKYDWCLIQLDDVSQCYLKKKYTSAHTDEYGHKPTTQLLEQIVLIFEFKNKHTTVEIPFYSYQEYVRSKAFAQERKAKDWEIVLSKMLNQPLRKAM